MSEVTFVLTSCGRFDLLERTIDSFLSFNNYPIKEYLLIEDSCDLDVLDKIKKKYGHLFKILFNEQKLGQIKSIDKAYQYVKTPYVFHCEDDWLFFRHGFIENSMDVLKEQPSAITVWLRDLWDTNQHPVGRVIEQTSTGVLYRKLSTDFGCFGFSFNPGLRRLSDYLRIAPFDNIGHEYDIGKIYQKLGYWGVILETSAVEHIGWKRHITDATIKKNLLQRLLKKINRGYLIVTRFIPYSRKR